MQGHQLPPGLQQILIPVPANQLLRQEARIPGAQQLVHEAIPINLQKAILRQAVRAVRRPGVTVHRPEAAVLLHQTAVRVAVAVHQEAPVQAGAVVQEGNEYTLKSEM